jgi:signal transduction histidine kinase
MSKELLRSLPFDVAARLPLQLGRDSIGSSTAAITELIKNSYDANSENVRISFVNRDAPIARLQIEDDGDGMDLRTLEQVWLRIGTEHKSDAERSSTKKRVFTGAKGLGRLGIDRLCKRVIVQTKMEEMDHVLEMQINWRLYSNKDATISGVIHNIFKIPFLAGDKHSDFFKDRTKGTRLILIGLKEEWKDSRIADLKSELSLLVSPFSSISDFNIELYSGVEEIDGLLSSEKILEAAAWEISASIDEDNQVRATYAHRQTNEIHTPPASDWKEWLPDRSEIPQCGPLDIKIYYVPQPGSEVSTSVSKKDWRTFMTLQHGVRIYRDLFRVRPYGEPSGRGDWLDLGLRKTISPGGIRQGGWRVAPRQLIGAVFISRLKNKKLDDQTNREGMVETEGYFDLRAFTLKIISEFEALATDHARRFSQEDPLDEISKKLEESISKSQQAVESLTEAVQREESAQDGVIKVKLLEMQQFVEQTRLASEKHKEAYTSKKEELEREKDTLANLASLGILTVCFGHEAKEFCNLAAVAAVELKETYQAGKFMIAPALEGTLLSDLDIIIDSTKFIKSFAAFSLGNVSKEKRKKKPVNIASVVERVVLALNEALTRQNISIDMHSVNKDIFVGDSYEIDWESIFINMISNSIWAMTKTPAGNRNIDISVGKIREEVEIRFKDSGCGLESGTEKYIFNPMYSTRRDDKGNTVGTGMGLAIINTFITEHSGGHVKAYANSDLGGAEFVITVPSGETP